MITTTNTAPLADTSIASIALVAFFGLVVLFVAGFAQADTLHNSTHDTRHAAGFPCH